MGHKSPAKILRSAKRFTTFLLKKCHLPALTVPKKATPHLMTFKAQSTSIPPKPIPRLTIQCVQTTNLPPSNHLQTCSARVNTLPLPAEKSNPIANEFGSLLKQFEEETRKESEKFKIEMKSELEKIVSEFVLSPWTEYCSSFYTFHSGFLQK